MKLACMRLTVDGQLDSLEKVKFPATGIVVGTLGVAGYGEAVDTIRSLAKAAGKKTYTLLMGKPSPAKLANFLEVDVFVLVADPQVPPPPPRSKASSFPVGEIL